MRSLSRPRKPVQSSGESMFIVAVLPLTFVGIEQGAVHMLECGASAAHLVVYEGLCLIPEVRVGSQVSTTHQDLAGAK